MPGTSTGDIRCEVWRQVNTENGTETAWVNTGKPYKHKSKEQMIRWYNKSFACDTDSIRYKALGNSIALPFWFWLLRRISALYERPATLGSLFDGIGGDPDKMCWVLTIIRRSGSKAALEGANDENRAD